MICEKQDLYRLTYYDFQMPFDKIKSFWKNSTQSINQSFNQRNGSFIMNYFSNTVNLSMDTAEFGQILDVVSARKQKKRNHRHDNEAVITTIKAKKLLKKIEPYFLSSDFQIRKQWFSKNKQQMLDYQLTMQDSLDQIEVCLYSSISYQFDEVFSVVQTIISLELVVTDNQQKLRRVRTQNLSRIKMITEKQIKIAKIKKKVETIQKLKAMAEKLKEYKNIASHQDHLTDSTIYNKIQAIRLQRQNFDQLTASNKLDAHLGQIQQNLKKNYSDKLNENIFNYVTGAYEYSHQFWEKFSSKSYLFEPRSLLQGTTAILERTILTDEETTVQLSKIDTRELEILADIKNGWKDSSYLCLKIKEDFYDYCHSKYKKFIDDFRIFCFEARAHKQLELSEPNLSDLLVSVNPHFCNKVFTYYCDLQRTILHRYFSLALLCFKFLELEETTQDLLTSQRQFLEGMKQNFFESIGYVCSLVISRLIDLVEMKSISSIEIAQFKEILSIFEELELYIQQSFIEKLDLLLMDGAPCNIQQTIGITTLRTFKQTKIKLYLENMHSSYLVELKNKLQKDTWQQIEIPTQYYDSIHFLLAGQFLNIRSIVLKDIENKKRVPTKLYPKDISYETSVLMESMCIQNSPTKSEKKFIADFRIIRNNIYIKGKSFKITETLLFVIQSLENYTHLALSFPYMQQQIGTKLSEFLQAYNSSANKLILQKGALKFNKINSKTIKSKHLALSSVCLMFILLITDFISERIEIYELSKLKTSYTDHIDQIINTIQEILLSHTKKAISDINFKKTPSTGTEAITNTTKILFEILSNYYSNKHLERIFKAEVLNHYLTAVKKIKIKNKMQAQALKSDVTFFFNQLYFLQEITPQFNENRMIGEQLIEAALGKFEKL